MLQNSFGISLLRLSKPIASNCKIFIRFEDNIDCVTLLTFQDRSHCPTLKFLERFSTQIMASFERRWWVRTDAASRIYILPNSTKSLESASMFEKQGAAEYLNDEKPSGHSSIESSGRQRVKPANRPAVTWIKTSQATRIDALLDIVAVFDVSRSECFTLIMNFRSSNICSYVHTYIIITRNQQIHHKASKRWPD